MLERKIYKNLLFVIGILLTQNSPLQAQDKNHNSTVEKSPVVEFTPAIGALGLNYMTTGAMLANAWNQKTSGLLYDGLNTTDDIHGVPQWQIISGGLAGGAIGIGLGYINTYLTPPTPQETLIAQTFTHLALPLAATGSIFIIQPSSAWTGFVYLSSAALTLPMSFFVGNQSIKKNNLITGQLFALNLALAGGSTLAALSPFGTSLGFPTLEKRPTDISVGGFLIFGAAGMALGPMGHALLSPYTQKQVTRALWGSLLGSSFGWILGLTLDNTAFADQNTLNVAPAIALGGQALGALIAGFSKMEEE